MRICPICEESLDGIVCRNCGYDASLDYEKYPTVMEIPVEITDIDAATISDSKPVCTESSDWCTNEGNTEAEEEYDGATQIIPDWLHAILTVILKLVGIFAACYLVVSPQHDTIPKLKTILPVVVVAMVYLCWKYLYKE